MEHSEKNKEFYAEVVFWIIAVSITFVTAIWIIFFAPSYFKSEEKRFYKTAEIIDVVRDDDAEYHLLVKYKNGTVESFSDVRGIVKMGNYTPTVELLFYRSGKTERFHKRAKIYLPSNYKIEFHQD